jgi:hypothetical protein
MEKSYSEQQVYLNDPCTVQYRSYYITCQHFSEEFTDELWVSDKVALAVDREIFHCR